MFLAKNGGKNDELLERIGLFRANLGLKSPMSVWGAWDLLTQPHIILYSVHYARVRKDYKVTKKFWIVQEKSEKSAVGHKKITPASTILAGVNEYEVTTELLRRLFPIEAIPTVGSTSSTAIFGLIAKCDSGGIGNDIVVHYVDNRHLWLRK